MSSISLSWDDFWPYFERQPAKDKLELLRQINMVDFLLGLSAQYQTEVLLNAPDDLTKTVEKILYLQTRVNLGLISKQFGNSSAIRLI